MINDINVINDVANINPVLDGESDIIGYMCKTDFDWHVGEDSVPSTMYKSLEEFQDAQCCKYCGIVQVKLTKGVTGEGKECFVIEEDLGMNKIDIFSPESGGSELYTLIRTSIIKPDAPFDD